MFKTRKRWISVLLTMAMLVAFCIPTAAPVGAASASGYEALQVPEIDTDDVYGLGTVLCSVRAGALKAGDTISLRLPTDFQFLLGNAKDKEVMTNEDWKTRVVADQDSSLKNYIEVPARYAGDDNILAAGDLAVEQLGDNEIKVSVNNITYANNDAVYFLLHMDNIYVASDAKAGDVELIASGPTNTGFPKGSVSVARISDGNVKLTVIDDPTFSDDINKSKSPVTVRIEEELNGSLEKADKSLKLVLPNGFEWQDFDKDDFKLIWGAWNHDGEKGNPVIGDTKSDNNSDLVVYADKDEMIIKVNKESKDAACFELTLGVNVANENKAKKGDVVVKVRGDSDTSVTELTVGNYGEYGVTVKADGDPTTVFAGKTEQEIADITIKEDVKGSLIEGRTITFKLPSNAKWAAVDPNSSDNSVALDFQGFVGDDGREIKYRVNGTSDDAAEITLENFEVVLEPGVAGDLKVEVGGTQGLTDELVLAKVLKPIDVKASATKDVKIGMKGQAVGDLVITESAEEAISDGEDIILELPQGVKFETVPTVKVTEGDLDIDEDGIKRQDSDSQLVIPVEGTSNDPSTIEITGIEYTVDRTVAEGDIKVKVKGNAVVEVNDVNELKDYFGNDIDDNNWVNIEGKKAFRLKEDGTMIWPQSKTAAEAVNAKVVTPAPGDQTGTAVFKIGEKTYTVNGQEVEMDVAPVAEAGRTYLPARFVANAMGVPDANITWDQNSQTVTVLKGDRVVQMKVGSKQILVNGIAMNMDVAPKVVPGRVLIPFRFLAQSLGAEVVWDAADANTITLNF